MHSAHGSVAGHPCPPPCQFSPPSPPSCHRSLAVLLDLEQGWMGGHRQLGMARRRCRCVVCLPSTPQPCRDGLTSIHSWPQTAIGWTLNRLSTAATSWSSPTAERPKIARLMGEAATGCRCPPESQPIPLAQGGSRGDRSTTTAIGRCDSINQLGLPSPPREVGWVSQG